MNEIALRLARKLFDTPVIQNQYRSAFIEAMIEPILASDGWRYAGDSWGGWDFDHPDGTKLELKQSAAQQTWSNARHLRTRGAFDIAARTGYYDQGGSRWTVSPGRPAQIYVFAWNGVYGPATDHRDPSQWDFFVVPTILLPAQKTLSLSTLRRVVTSGGVGPLTIHDLVPNVNRLKSWIDSKTVPFRKFVPDRSASPRCRNMSCRWSQNRAA